MFRRKHPFFSLWFLIPLAVLYSSLVVNYWTPTNDSALYICAAKSIINGKGYYFKGTIVYPPFFFPLMLSPIVGIWGYNFAAMRILVIATAIGSVGCTYLLFRSRVRTKLAAAITFLTAISYPLMFENTRILSDLPYMFFSLLALTFFSRYLEEKKLTSIYGMVFILLVIIAYFTRLIAVSLLAGTCLYLLVEGYLGKKGSLWIKKALLVILVFAIPAGGWWIRGKRILQEEQFMAEDNRWVEKGSSYCRRLSFSCFVDNFDYYRKLVGVIIGSSKQYIPGQTVLLTLVFLFGLGWCVFYRRSILEYYFIAYLGIYLFYCAQQGTRFLVPVTPLIFYYFLQGCKIIGKKSKNLLEKISYIRENISLRKMKIVFLSLIIIILAYPHVRADVKLIKSQHRKIYYQGVVADFIQTIKWVKDRTPKDTVIVSDRAHWGCLLGNRHFINFPRTSDQKIILKSLNKNKAQYLIYSPVTFFTEKYLEPLIKDNPQYFQEIYRKNNSVVYKIKNFDIKE